MRASSSRRSRTSSTSCSSTRRRTTTRSGSRSRAGRSSQAACSSPTTSSPTPTRSRSIRRRGRPTPTFSASPSRSTAAWSSASFCADRFLRYICSTAERRWSGSDFRQYGQWRYQRVEAQSPRPPRETPSQRRGRRDPRRSAQLPSRSRIAPLPIRAGNRNKGPRKRPLILCRDALRNRDCFRGERRQVKPELLEQLTVEETALVVEALGRAADRDLRADGACAGDAEDSLQILLRPQGAELACACAGNRDRLVAEGRVEPRPRCPVDRVLQTAGDGAVVLGRDEEDRVGGAPRLAQPAHRLRRVVAVEFLVVERQLREPFPELKLDTLRRGLGGGPQEARVVRALPQAAGNAEDPHRQLAALTSARSALIVTSSPR